MPPQIPTTDAVMHVDLLSVGFTPVKGMRHLPQPMAAFDHHGPVGDREFCLVDTVTRRVLKTVQHPSLVAVMARWEDDELVITRPDGRSVREVPESSGDEITCTYWGRPVDLELMNGGHDALVSSWLDHDVRLARAPRDTIVYGDPVTLVTTGSLRHLGQRAGLDHLVAQASRFRATLLVETSEPYVEDTWQGRLIGAAGHVFRVGAPVPRCAVVDIDPVDGTRTSRILRSLLTDRPSNAEGEPHFGRYARLL